MTIRPPGTRPDPRRNGDLTEPVEGTSDDDPGSAGDDAGAEGVDADDDGTDDGDADELRDAGKKALDAMKAQRNKARSQLRPWAALARELGVQTADQARALLAGKARGDSESPDPEQIRREARAEVEREVARDRLLDKIEAKAGGKFTDPADAAALLLRENDPGDFLDGTRVDGEAIAEALDDLLERKPYLAAKQAPTVKTPKPDRSQGSRGGARPPAADRATRRLERLGIKKPTSTSN